MSREYLALVEGRAGVAQRHDRRPPGPRPPPAHPPRRARRRRARGAHPLRGDRARCPPTPRARPAGDRPHAPDPRPFRRDQATRSRATPSTAAAGRHGLERQFLHAARLGFTHPVTGEGLASTPRCRADLATALERARKGGSLTATRADARQRAGRMDTFRIGGAPRDGQSSARISAPCGCRASAKGSVEPSSRRAEVLREARSPRRQPDRRRAHIDGRSEELIARGPPALPGRPGDRDPKGGLQPGADIPIGRPAAAADAD